MGDMFWFCILTIITSFNFLRYAYVKYMKSLFTNIQKQ